VNGGTISEYALWRLRRIVFLLISVAFPADDETVVVAVAVVHPTSVCGVSRISGE
jgi:hypothetical protein